MATYTAPTAQLGTPEYTKQLQDNAMALGITPPSPTIDGSGLENVTPLKINPPTPTISTATEIISGAEATVERNQREAEAEAQAEKDFAPVKEAQAKKTGLMDSLGSLFGQKKEVINEASQDTSIDPYREDLAKINTDIGDITVEYRGVQDQIKGRGDITKEAQAGLMVNAEEKYGRVLADLAIRQSAANQNIEQMEKSADRKLALSLAAIDSDITFYKDFLLENADQLTTQEKELVNMKVSAREAEKARITTEESTATDALKTALQNGIRIPDAVVRQVLADPKNAYAILARNGISLQDPLDRQIKQAQLAKLNVELSESQLEAIDGEQSPYQKERQTRILQSVDELMNRVGIATVGPTALLRFAPGSNPKNFKTDLDTLKASIAFGELTAMREASKTGGALGQVSNIELGLLESALGGLDQTQSPANFRKNLNKIKASIERWQNATNTVGGGGEEAELRALGYTEEQIQQIKDAQ